MEKNRKREIQVRIFRFFVPEGFRKPLKNFVYHERAKLRFKKFLQKGNKNTPKIDGLLVSLTSFPGRISTISDTLVSLLSQSRLPEKTLLWLGEEQFPNREKDIPENILKLQNYGLEIRWCKDLKSYKKLIPALTEFPEHLLVTADDDIYYPKNWLKNLYESYSQDPDSIYCHRVHKITFDEKAAVKPYQDWEKCIINGQEKPEDILFFTTGGGVLFPPNCFHSDVLCEDLFQKLCPLADDIWFWTMIRLNKKPIKICKNNVYRIKNNGNTQEDEPLWKVNREAGLNDDQLKNIIDYYGAEKVFG